MPNSGTGKFYAKMVQFMLDNHAKYVELFFDRATGEVWTNYQYSLGQNSWTEYDKKDVVKVCNLSEPTTMQQIADRIKERLDEIAAEARWEALAERA